MAEQKTQTSLPLEQRINTFLRLASKRLDKSVLSTQLIDRVAMASDASFYRLVPAIIARPSTPDEVAIIFGIAIEANVPVTVRAAGTSLSGQAITNGVLMALGANWRDAQVLDGGEKVRLQPGVRGAEANRLLKPYARKIGPDPASIDVAKIGGIAANNASGMCCGVAQNSYQTLQSMTLVLANGALLDTGCSKSREVLAREHPGLLSRIKSISDRVKADTELSELIRRKYKIKNTIGYSLNALIDFEDPIDILQHLIIGSEGTLGFIAEIVLRTVEDPPHRATALYYFEDLEAACAASASLCSSTVAAVELMDRVSLETVTDKLGLSEDQLDAHPQMAALLVEIREGSPEVLADRVSGVSEKLAPRALPFSEPFSIDAKTQAYFWSIRKGIFPAVGAVKSTGETVIIEDVSFPEGQLKAGVVQLRQLLDRCGYETASIFGHALASNVHFTFSQSFERDEDVSRYSNLMDEVVALVADGYQGSLKAEHGTGRNMAPFVAREWGPKAYAVMKEIKSLIDPNGILNPDVIISDDPNIHLKHLKDLPAADEIVDKCIECGFCEPACPSKDLTLSPRQRIAVTRELARMNGHGSSREKRALEKAYAYSGDETCAACGICAIKCPVDINTGDLTRANRASHQSGDRIARFIAKRFSSLLASARFGLAFSGIIAGMMGRDRFARVSAAFNRWSGRKIPAWRAGLPGPARSSKQWVSLFGDNTVPKKAPHYVYFSACGTRTFGADPSLEGASSVQATIAKLAKKAGVKLTLPEVPQKLCCGMAFDSRGFSDVGQSKADELARAVSDSAQSFARIVTDMSACAQHLTDRTKVPFETLDPVEFVHRVLLPSLQLSPIDKKVVLHLPCSVRKLQRAQAMIEIAEMCASEVHVLDQLECCGFAGDKGFFTPDLNTSALNGLNPKELDGAAFGVSTNRTCEFGLTEKTDFPWISLFELLDRASE